MNDIMTWFVFAPEPTAIRRIAEQDANNRQRAYWRHVRAAYKPLDGWGLGQSVQVLAGEAFSGGGVCGAGDIAGGATAHACCSRAVRGSSSSSSDEHRNKEQDLVVRRSPGGGNILL